VGIDEFEVDGVSIDSVDSGLPLPADLFPIQVDPIDAELEGELEGGIDDSFIEFIPMITGGSVGFDDKIEIKMHYDGDPKDATISPRAIISAPLGTSCTMSIEPVQVDEGLPFPFIFDSALELPAGENTIRIVLGCENEGDCNLVLNEFFITIEEPTYNSVIPDCLINDVVIDGVSLDIPGVPIPPNTRTNTLEGTESVTIEDSLTLELDCEVTNADVPWYVKGELPELQGDTDTDVDVDVDVIGAGE
jgi:hypothetical protein